MSTFDNNVRKCMHTQPAGRPYVREGEGVKFFTGLADQYRTREFVYAFANFDRGGVGRVAL